MLEDLAAVLFLGLLCGGWVAAQQWIGKHDPGAPGVEGDCHTCSQASSCERKARPLQFNEANVVASTAPHAAVTAAEREE